MNVSVPRPLANLTLSNLNFTANCENAILGYKVWYNDFLPLQSTAGDSSTPVDPKNNISQDLMDIWTNGISPDFIGFWRATLPPTLSKVYFSDAEIAAWTNSTSFYEFFEDDIGDAWPRPDKLDQIANSLATSGGCKNNNSQDAGDIQAYSQFQQGRKRGRRGLDKDLRDGVADSA